MLNEVMGEGLKLLGRVAGSDLVDRLGLRKQTEKAVYSATRAGFEAAQQVGAAIARRKGAQVSRMPSKKRPSLFNLNLSEEEALFKETARRFAEARFRPAAEAADEACEAPEGLLEACWEELGVGLMALPEALGGAGFERMPLATSLILEELSRGDMALALAAAAPLGVLNALVDFGTAEQQAQWLAPFGEGGFVPAAIALMEPRPLFDPNRLKTRAILKDGGYTLYGEKCLVPLGRQARFFLVAAEVLGGGIFYFIVPSDAEGLVVEHEPSMGLRGADLCRIKLDGVRVGREALLGERQAPFDPAALVDGARIAWGALTVGTCQAVLEYVSEYCNERYAFGEPITHRQSVSFLIADIAIELDGMRLIVYRAASRAEHGLDARREACLARFQCAEKGMKIGTDGVQLLGGHGFVKDHPVERWYRHLRAIGVVEGSLYV